MKRTRNLFAAGLTFGLIVALQSGCARTAALRQPAANPEAISQGAAKPAVVSEIRILSGKVVETMNAGAYTYVNLEKDGKTAWLALPAIQVSVGQVIEARPGMQMGQFTSKTLNRTFEEIVFSSGLVTDTKAYLPPGHPSMEAKPQSDRGQSTPDAKAQPKGRMGMMARPAKEMTAVSGKVVETMDSGGYTYICLERGGKNVWAAVPTMIVSVGQELKLQPGQEMFNFKSKSLNRTFDSVIFSGGALPAT